mgnify:FL=1
MSTRDSFKAYLVPLKDPDQPTFFLSSGSNNIGRGWNGIQDKRLSRNHLEIVFNKEKGIVSIVAVSGSVRERIIFLFSIWN